MQRHVSIYIYMCKLVYRYVACIINCKMCSKQNKQGSLPEEINVLRVHTPISAAIIYIDCSNWKLQPN